MSDTTNRFPFTIKKIEALPFATNKGERVNELYNGKGKHPYNPQAFPSKLLENGSKEKLSKFITDEGKAYFNTDAGKKELELIIQAINANKK